MKRVCGLAVLSLLVVSGAARAESTAAPPSMPLTPDPDALHKLRMEKSLQCSRQADSRNLNGAPRKDFMRVCLKS